MKIIIIITIIASFVRFTGRLRVNQELLSMIDSQTFM